MDSSGTELPNGEFGQIVAGLVFILWPDDLFQDFKVLQNFAVLSKY